MDPQTSAWKRFLISGRVPGSPERPTRLQRDARIDVVRGLALLVIFINHMPGNVVARFMPHNFGFSDAADAFVLLAGVSATLAYGNLFEQRGVTVGMLRLGARLWTLYISHIAVFIIVCGVVAAAVTRTQNPLYLEAINIQPFFNDTFEAVINMVTLRYQPYYLDILPLYIVLLALFPALYCGVRRSPLATLMVSLAIWQGALLLDFNLPNAGSTGWFFNPFAWQVIFTFGVVIGRAAQLGLAAPNLRWLDLAAVMFLFFAVVVKLSSGNPFEIALLNDWIDSVQLGSDKTNLAWSRLLHGAALAWLVIRWSPAGNVLLSSRIGRGLAAIGRHSLDVFCTGIVLSIIGQIILAETAFALGTQLLVCLSGITVLVGLGNFLSWYQSFTLARAPAAQSLAQASSARR